MSISLNFKLDLVFRRINSHLKNADSTVKLQIRPSTAGCPAAPSGSTPLGHLLNTHIFILDALHHSLETVTLLLRAGASLDACRDDDPAEVMLDTNIGDPTFTYERASDPNYVALKTLVAGVRRAGSWKLWTLENTKALLRLRSLIARGRAREKRRLRKVMTYWNPRV